LEWLQKTRAIPLVKTGILAAVFLLGSVFVALTVVRPSRAFTNPAAGQTIGGFASTVIFSALCSLWQGVKQGKGAKR